MKFCFKTEIERIEIIYYYLNNFKTHYDALIYLLVKLSFVSKDITDCEISAI